MLFGIERPWAPAIHCSQTDSSVVGKIERRVMISISLMECVHSRKGCTACSTSCVYPYRLTASKHMNTGIVHQGCPQGLNVQGVQCLHKRPCKLGMVVYVVRVDVVSCGQAPWSFDAPWALFKKTVGCAFAHTQLCCPTSGLLSGRSRESLVSIHMRLLLAVCARNYITLMTPSQVKVFLHLVEGATRVFWASTCVCVLHLSERV